MTHTEDMNKATHRGSCQCCGAVQKLPEGVLAKHGYTTKWGFFSGTCQGSGWQPYEKAFNLIERFIASAQAKKEELLAFREKLAEEPTDTTKGWYRVYRNASRYTPSGYVWMQVPLTFVEHTSTSDPEYKWLTCTYEHPDKTYTGNVRNERLEFYAKARSLNPVDYVRELNFRRSEDLKKDIAKVDEYIAWQKLRIERWVEADLLEVK